MCYSVKTYYKNCKVTPRENKHFHWEEPWCIAAQARNPPAPCAPRRRTDPRFEVLPGSVHTGTKIVCNICNHITTRK